MRRSTIGLILLVLRLILFVACTGADSPSQYRSSTGIEFVLVEAGSFIMGTSVGEASSGPEHKVTLTRSYYISRMEITFSLFDQFWQETQDKVRWEKAHDFGYGRDDRPIVGITWYEAVKFCNWLSQKEDLQPAYKIGGAAERVTWIQNSDGYRLPTEAEWECAAKGGLLSKGFVYAGSDDLDEVAWYGDNSGWKTHPVGMKKPNELGLYDMSGNVGEYCWDWIEYFNPNGNEEIDPQGPKIGDYKVVRGGSHIDHELFLRTNYRCSVSVNSRSNVNGIRVVRYITPTE